MKNHLIAALYKFAPLEQLETLQQDLLDFCTQADLCGTLLIATEGINGTVAGPEQGIKALIQHLQDHPQIQGVTPKYSHCEEAPFYRMKVKLKREIVTMGVEGIDPNDTVGEYIAPENWNELISDPDVLLIDTRNRYETRVGTFKHAIDPDTTNFREFPDYVKQHFSPHQHKKVAMFCTGGIRCEKASAYMKQQGFESVYHLQGGILNYLEKIPQDESLWQGECFVFDNRVSVDHNLNPGKHGMCHACREPLTKEEMQSQAYIEGVSCPYCIDKISAEKKAALEERQKQIRLAKARGIQHIGQDQKHLPENFPEEP